MMLKCSLKKYLLTNWKIHSQIETGDLGVLGMPKAAWGVTMTLPWIMGSASVKYYESFALDWNKFGVVNSHSLQRGQNLANLVQHQKWC